MTAGARHLALGGPGGEHGGVDGEGRLVEEVVSEGRLGRRTLRRGSTSGT